MDLLHSIIYPRSRSLIDQVCQHILSSLHLLDLDDLLIHSVVRKPRGMVMGITMDTVMGGRKVAPQVEEVVY